MINTTDVPADLREKLAEYLNKLKDKRKLGFNQLSVKAGINSKSLNLMLNGETKRINPYQLQKLASALRVDYKDLYKIVGYLEETEELKVVSNAQILDIELEAIPLFDSISAGCGNDPAEIVDHIVLPGKKGTNYFAVKVVGDSMEPRIPNNSILVVKRDEIAENGRVGAFITSDGAVVKRVHRNKTTTMLLSDNTSYPPIVISEGDTYHECGKVVQVLLPEGEI